MPSKPLTSFNKWVAQVYKVWKDKNLKKYKEEEREFNDKMVKRIRASGQFSYPFSMGYKGEENDMQTDFAAYDQYPSSGLYDDGYNKRMNFRDFMNDAYKLNQIVETVVQIDVHADDMWLFEDWAPVKQTQSPHEIRYRKRIYPITLLTSASEHGVPPSLPMFITEGVAQLTMKFVGYQFGMLYLQGPESYKPFLERLQQVRNSVKLTMQFEAAMVLSQVSQISPLWSWSSNAKPRNLSAFLDVLYKECVNFACVQKERLALSRLVREMSEEMTNRGVVFSESDLVLVITDDTVTKLKDTQIGSRFIDTGKKIPDDIEKTSEFKVPGVGTVRILKPIPTEIGAPAKQIFHRNVEIGEFVPVRYQFLDGRKKTTSSQDVLVFESDSDRWKEIEYRSLLNESGLFKDEKDSPLTSLGQEFFIAYDATDGTPIPPTDGNWNYLRFLMCSNSNRRDGKNQGNKFLRSFFKASGSHRYHPPDAAGLTAFEDHVNDNVLDGKYDGVAKGLIMNDIKTNLSDQLPQDLKNNNAYSLFAIFTMIGSDNLFKFLEACHEFDITTGIGYALAWPHMRYKTSMIALFAKSPDLANSYYGPNLSTVGSDEVRQQIAGTYKLVHKCVVKEERKVCIRNGITVVEYRGGHSAKAMIPDDRTLAGYKERNEVPNGYFVLALRPHEMFLYEASAMDITGGFSPYLYEKSMNDPIHYEMSKAYTELWDWVHVKEKEPGINPYFMTDETKRNTICMLGTYHTRISSEKWSEPIRGRGHWGDTTGPNCMIWRTHGSGSATHYNNNSAVVVVK